MTFLFDTICDDLIEEIVKNFKWTKALCNWGKKTPYYLIVYHRLYNPTNDNYYISLSYENWTNSRNVDFNRWSKGWRRYGCNQQFKFYVDFPKYLYDEVENKIYKYKNGNIWYRYKQERFKECVKKI